MDDLETDKNILILEDERLLLESLSSAFELHGYAVQGFRDSNQAFQAALESNWDLFLFDIMVPGGNGIDLARAIRDHGIDTPIIFITAKDSIEDKLLGFTTGADDYITKPFELIEVIARAKAVMSRGASRTKTEEDSGVDTQTFKDVTINFKTKQIFRNGREVHMPKKQYDIFRFLFINHGVIISREEIEQHIWGVSDNSHKILIDTYISNIKKAIHEDGGEQIIHTKWREGYCIR